MSAGSWDALTGRVSPRARAVLAALAAAAVVVLLAVLPTSTDPVALPGASAAEREVLTLDVAPAGGPLMLNARLAAVRTEKPVPSRALVRTTSALPATGRTVTAPASRLPVLRVGDHGPAIAFLQKRLRVKVTGVFGPLTYAAVVAFQKRQGLPAHGIVGPATWRALVRPRVGAAAAPTARAAASTPRVSAPVTAGRVCPAPGASFGDGWLVPRSGHLHQGQDLMGHMGMPLLAIEDGVVLREGRQSNGALRIVLQGVSGSKFFYGHMSRDLVHAGGRVHRGQVIGLMGDSGSPGAVHLHFEFWRSGGESAAVDPAPLLHSLCG